MDIATIEKHLHDIEALVSNYQRMEPGPEASLFLNKIERLKANLDSLALDDTAIKQQGKNTRQLIKSIESRMFSVLISKLDSGLQITNLKNKKFIEQIAIDMKEYRTALESSKPNAFLPIDIMTTLLNSYHDSFYQQLTTPRAMINIPEVAEEAPVRKKRKARMVKIKTFDEVLEELEKQSEQLRNKVKAQQDKLKLVYDKACHTPLSDEDKQDLLIAKNRSSIIACINTLEELKRERKLLNAKRIVCRFQWAGSALNQLNTKQRKQIILALTIIGALKPGIEPDALTQEHLDLLNIKGAELQKKQFYPQMIQQVIEYDKGYLEKLMSFETVISEATSQILERQNERDNPKIQTDLDNKISDLNATFYLSIQSLPIDSDPAVKPLLTKHQAIFAKIAPLLSAQKTATDGLRLIPQQAERIARQIAINQQLIKTLKPIEDQLVTSLEALTSARKEAIEKRKIQATEAKAMLNIKVIQALEQIKCLHTKYSLHPDFKAAVKTAKPIITTMFETINRLPIDKPMNTITRLQTEEKNLQLAMEPILDVLLKEIIRLQNLIIQLKEEKTLKDVDGFSVQEIKVIEDKLLAIDTETIKNFKPLDEFNRINEELESITAALKEKKGIAESLKLDIQERSGSEAVKAIKKMIEKIEVEQQSIQKKNPTDPRLYIFSDIQTGLRQQLTPYLQLKTDINTFITQSINTINNNLSPNSLKKLTDAVANPFIKFIRRLLQPINQLIQRMKNNPYRSNFFAKPTERSIAQAANEALNKLKKTLDVCESQHQPPIPPYQKT
ncbi:hypothetical protein [Legionella yabuuchiae]|uniref:hypothetical protein n=1 Tax=Legionella yabuuchiae TaxID=376727 RepID=UPI001055EFD3|nr:hypothetical protein [Legionella yabuuchiae]